MTESSLGEANQLLQMVGSLWDVENTDPEAKRAMNHDCGKPFRTHTLVWNRDAWHQHEGDWNHCHFHSCLQRNMTPEVGPWFPGLLLREQDKSNVRDSPLHCDFLGILWLMLINCPKCIQGETCRGMLCSQSSVHAFHSGFPEAGLQRWEAFGIKLHKYGKLWAEVICLQIFFMPKIYFPLKSCFSF